MHANRERGIQYNSHGNLEPVCYFGSGYRQKKLYDKPQYGYIIFWGGGARDPVKALIHELDAARRAHRHSRAALCGQTSS